MSPLETKEAAQSAHSFPALPGAAKNMVNSNVELALGPEKKVVTSVAQSVFLSVMDGTQSNTSGVLQQNQ